MLMTLFVDIRLGLTWSVGVGHRHSDRLCLPVRGLADVSTSLFSESVLGMYLILTFFVSILFS